MSAANTDQNHTTDSTVGDSDKFRFGIMGHSLPV